MINVPQILQQDLPCEDRSRGNNELKNIGLFLYFSSFFLQFLELPFMNIFLKFAQVKISTSVKFIDIVKFDSTQQLYLD